MPSVPARTRAGPARPLVLIVDDEASSRMVLGAIFRNLAGGADIIAFEDPVQALVWAHRHRAWLVVSDFHMPHMDGGQLVAKLRALAGYAHTPIIVVSASEHGDELALAAHAGADRVLPKPMPPHELLAVAERLIAERGPGAHGHPHGTLSALQRLWRRLTLRLPR